MANDRFGQFEREVRARSEARDAEITEVREALSVALSKQGALEARVTELAGVVNALRDVKPTSVLALWGPAIALAAAVASAGSFVLNTTVGPVKEKADAAQLDGRELSSLYGSLAQGMARETERNNGQDKLLELYRQEDLRLRDRLRGPR